MMYSRRTKSWREKSTTQIYINKKDRYNYNNCQTINCYRNGCLADTFLALVIITYTQNHAQTRACVCNMSYVSHLRIYVSISRFVEHACTCVSVCLSVHLSVCLRHIRKTYSQFPGIL